MLARSPARGFSVKIVPTATCAIGTCASPSGFLIRAVGGLRSSSAATARRARPMLHASRVRDTANRNATVAASNHSPSAMAPMIATVISRFMSGRSRTNESHALRSTKRTPHRMPTAYSPMATGGTVTAPPRPSLPRAGPMPPAAIACTTNPPRVKLPLSIVNVFRARRSSRIGGGSARVVSDRSAALIPVRATAAMISAAR